MPPRAEVIIGAQEMQDPPPSFGVDVGEPAAVDAAHAEAVRRGLRVVYPLTDEPWGVRRFFVEDPGGTIVNVLAHITQLDNRASTPASWRSIPQWTQTAAAERTRAPPATVARSRTGRVSRAQPLPASTTATRWVAGVR